MRVWILSILLLSTAAHAGDWAQPGFRLRRIVTLDDFPAGAKVAHARFVHLGHLRRDGADIRVTDAQGKLVKHELLRLGPGDQAEILFDCADAKQGARYRIYFGNSDAPAPAAWTAEAGVVLEVRRRGAGDCLDWKQFEALLANSKEVLGRNLRTRIFDGFNPIGPSTDIVTHYRAYFRTDKAGIHVFATTSDDASFLLVNGKRVAEMPGWHGAVEGQQGQYRGSIKLDAGVHRMDYYHVQGGGDMATVAAWGQPGDAYPTLMPESAFLPIARGRTLGLARMDGRPAHDLVWHARDHLGANGQWMVRYALELRGATPGAVTLDFGDGTKAQVTAEKDRPVQASHIYLRMGEMTVVASQNGSELARARVVAEPVWMQREEWVDQRWPEYRAALLERMKREALPPDSLAAAIAFAGLQNDAEIFKPLHARAWQVLEEIPNAEKVALFTIIGQYQIKPFRDYAATARALQVAADTPVGGAAQARARLQRAEVMIHAEAKSAEALALLKLIPDEALESPSEKQLKVLFTADALAGMGRPTEALALYDTIQKGAPATDRKNAVLRASRLLSVRSFIERKDYDAALEELQRFQADAPAERIAEETALLKAECWLGQQQYALAAALMQRQLAAFPGSAREPEMLLALMKAWRGLKRADFVKETYARLKKDHPYAAETALGKVLVD